MDHSMFGMAPKTSRRQALDCWYEAKQRLEQTRKALDDAQNELVKATQEESEAWNTLLIEAGRSGPLQGVSPSGQYVPVR